MKHEKIYVASSWRNMLQPAVVSALRLGSAGHICTSMDELFNALGAS